MTEQEFRARVNAEVRAVVAMYASRYAAEQEHAEWQAFNITVDEHGVRWMLCRECGGSGRREWFGHPDLDGGQCIPCNGKGKKDATGYMRGGRPC